MRVRSPSDRRQQNGAPIMFAKKLGLAAACLFIAKLGFSPALAITYTTYNVDLPPGGFDSVTGTITTDGQGVLSAADITSFNLQVRDQTLNNGQINGAETISFTSSNSNVSVAGSVVAAGNLLLAFPGSITFTNSNGDIETIKDSLSSGLSINFTAGAPCSSATCPESGSIGLGFVPISSSATSVSTTPLPPAVSLFATGLAAIGLLGWLRGRKGFATIAA
jgi:hypothetical protein